MRTWRTSHRMLPRLEAQDTLDAVSRIGVALSGGDERRQALAALERQAAGPMPANAPLIPSDRPRALPQMGLGLEMEPV